MATDMKSYLKRKNDIKSREYNSNNVKNRAEKKRNSILKESFIDEKINGLNLKTNVKI
jgi:hypothetical protein